MIVRARAPLRISFSGGGTDLLPYAEAHGGLVLNATIDRYAYATLRFPLERVLRVNSLDLNMVAQYGLDEPLIHDGKLGLVKACLNRLRPPADAYHGGIDLYLETEAPPGSGLGGSSALVVAIVAALAEWRRVRLDKYQMAHLAWEIERKDVGIAGGMQDQYAAVFGGLNLIDFYGSDNVVVNGLRIAPSILTELQYNMLLVFTGAPRRENRIIESQVNGYVEQRTEVVDALNHMKALTLKAKDALLKGRLQRLGEIVHEEWLQKKRTANSITTPEIEEMYEESRRLGAIGGKVSGAGGGGFMFLHCPFDRRPAVTQCIVNLGGQVIPFAFEKDGVQSWVWPEGSMSDEPGYLEHQMSPRITVPAQTSLVSV